ncbi:LytR/AlgR family response regulator transcription factor [Algoriphagus terrigena]|uniref:LytR/AlgR family response regulator transcription factor n=1 Tax=Algoriphagus terrigena TaxID=344884 RepID=UPI000401C186|nr:LytTR family DNA-binding domain-containing protein [Algoriphagus terrigena]
MLQIIKIGLIDDEPLQLDYLNGILNGIPGYQVVFSEVDPFIGLKLARQKVCEVLITDIQMEKLNGLIISEEMEELEMPVIVCTAYKEYAIESINVSVLGYLVKPPEVLDLKKLLGKARKKISDWRERAAVENRDFIFLNEDGHFGMTKVAIDSIFHLEQMANYTYFHVPPKVYKERSAIMDWIAKLPSNKFIQIHKSFVINLSKLERVMSREVILQNGKKVTIGAAFKDNLMKALGL